MPEVLLSPEVPFVPVNPDWPEVPDVPVVPSFPEVPDDPEVPLNID